MKASYAGDIHLQCEINKKTFLYTEQHPIVFLEKDNYLLLLDNILQTFENDIFQLKSDYLQHKTKATFIQPRINIF